MVVAPAVEVVVFLGDADFVVGASMLADELEEVEVCGALLGEVTRVESRCNRFDANVP